MYRLAFYSLYCDVYIILELRVPAAVQHVELKDNGSCTSIVYCICAGVQLAEVYIATAKWKGSSGIMLVAYQLKGGVVIFKVVAPDLRLLYWIWLIIHLGSKQWINMFCMSQCEIIEVERATVSVRDKTHRQKWGGQQCFDCYCRSIYM